MPNLLIVEDNATDFKIINEVLADLKIEGMVTYPLYEPPDDKTNQYFITDVITAIHCKETHPKEILGLKSQIETYFKGAIDFVILDRALEGNEDDMGIELADIFISRFYPNAKIILFSQFESSIDLTLHNYLKYINKYADGNTYNAVKQNLKNELTSIFQTNG